MLETNAQVPWQALRYVVGEITYGGRVTDDQDRRTLKTILAKYLTEDVLRDGFRFSESGIYQSVPVGTLDYYRELVRKFPEYENPEVFGMHDNANITFQLKESKISLETVLSIQPRESGGGGSSTEKTTDQIVDEMCLQFEQRLPPTLVRREEKPTKAGAGQHQQSMIDPLKVCCEQECERFNRLIQVQKNSLQQLRKAIKGEVLMSSELDRMYQQLITNQLPDIWRAKSYPCLKPLTSWFEDFLARISFFREWLNSDSNKMRGYWLPAFYFPQGFLTSVQQNYARLNQIAIDQLTFAFRFTNLFDAQQITAFSENGANIYGLFIEGAQYDTQKGSLEDSAPGEMFSRSPVIEFIPVENHK